MIPDRAEALIDLRPFAGQEDEVLARIREVIGDEIELEIVHHDIGLEVPFEGASSTRWSPRSGGTIPALRCSRT